MFRPKHQHLSLSFFCLLTTITVGAGLAFGVVGGGNDGEFGSSSQNDGGAGVAWTTVGSGGTVDEASDGLFKLTGPSIQFAGSAPGTAKLVVRYNVTATGALVNFVNSWAMGVRYRDNGEDSRVVVKLRSYNLATGQLTTLIKFDSDNFATSGNFQIQNVLQNPQQFTFDFNNFGYFCDVIISRTDGLGRPALGFIGLTGA